VRRGASSDEEPIVQRIVVLLLRSSWRIDFAAENLLAEHVSVVHSCRESAPTGDIGRSRGGVRLEKLHSDYIILSGEPNSDEG
jgi:hypothetical protein